MDSEQLFTKGFNAGYLLAKHEPDLLHSIIKNVQPTAPYLDGLFSGKEQHELEATQQNLEDLHNLRSSSKEQDRGRELEM